jgi:hypothetical protein
MLSSVLRSERTVRVNIEIMRAVVRLRQMLQANPEHDSSQRKVKNTPRQILRTAASGN